MACRGGLLGRGAENSDISGNVFACVVLEVVAPEVKEVAAWWMA
jgi:hypothetical protein